MSRTSIIEGRIKALEAELDKLQEWGEDTFKGGDVLRFKVKFQAGGMWYTYAALKCGNRWFITGNKMSYLTWDKLVEFWAGVYKVKGMKVASEWKDLG